MSIILYNLNFVYNFNLKDMIRKFCNENAPHYLKIFRGFKYSESEMLLLNDEIVSSDFN